MPPSAPQALFFAFHLFRAHILPPGAVLLGAGTAVASWVLVVAPGVELSARVRVPLLAAVRVVRMAAHMFIITTKVPRVVDCSPPYCVAAEGTRSLLTQLTA